MNVLVFDIETIPDIDGCRRLYDLHGLSDDDVAKAVYHKRRQETNTEVLRHHLHKIVAISAVLRTGDQFKLWSLGNAESDEQDLLQRFYSGLARYTPRLVSWNGRGFDLPVIHYRSLIYPINAGQYWDTGDKDSSFHSNNYQGKYHDRHTDLMEVLAGFQPSAHVHLNDIACLCGFPTQVEMGSDEIWSRYQADGLSDIRHYCEARVLNTYLVYLNHQRNRGSIDQVQYQTECQIVRDNLIASDQPELITFEKAWLDQ
ncbi:MAG: putative PolB exonuclease-like 3'-5' exonuclease [Gammaproteobacteria bacterium]|jgi:predicted PolB exonuclease-like 3'-5' exonuclease